MHSSLDVDIPQKGEADGIAQSTRKCQSPCLREIIHNLRSPSNLLRMVCTLLLIVVFIQGIPGSIPWGVYSSYLHDILANERHFSADAVRVDWRIDI